MIPPASGPFLFDTSAERWVTRDEPRITAWMREYLSRHPVHISAVTVVERIRGYSLLWRRAAEDRRAWIEKARLAYLNALGHVWPLDAPIATVAGEIMALLPDPPTPPKRSHQQSESRAERLARWRFEGMIAATALVARLPLIRRLRSHLDAFRDSDRWN